MKFLNYLNPFYILKFLVKIFLRIFFSYRKTTLRYLELIFGMFRRVNALLGLLIFISLYGIRNILRGLTRYCFILYNFN